jgi:hypothetical protein
MWRVDGLGGLELLRVSYGELVFTPTPTRVPDRGLRGLSRRIIYWSERHEVGPGGVLVLNPEEHAGGPVTEAPWQYRALYPDPDHLCEIAAEFPSDGQRISEFADAVVRDGHASHSVRRFHVVAEDAHFEPAPVGVGSHRSTPLARRAPRDPPGRNSFRSVESTGPFDGPVTPAPPYEDQAIERTSSRPMLNHQLE